MEVKRGPKRIIKTEVEDGMSEPRTVPLSNSDLVVPRVHVEVIFAFEAPVPTSKQLEDGLVKTLVKYKEWAGRFSKDSSGRPVIALNGQGVVWIDAETSHSLRSVMPFNPGWELAQLVPPNRGAEELLLIQVTKFSCGGMTLGVARHHHVADGEAASNFMEAWANAVKGSSTATPQLLHDRSALRAREPPRPEFDHPEYKRPPPPKAETGAEQAPPVEYPPLSMKKFHFGPEMLKKLKSEAMKDLKDGEGFYTTFESLTGYLWKSISSARGLSGDVATKVMIAVNGRRKFKPPIDDNYFGNVIFHGCSQATVQDLTEKPLSYATASIQKAIRRLDDQYLRSVLDLVELQQRNPVPVPVGRSFRTILSPNLSMTTWVAMPLYKLDFGYGTPIFAGPPLVPFEGLVMLLPSYTKDGGIDVVAGLHAPDMDKLEGFIHDL